MQQKSYITFVPEAPLRLLEPHPAQGIVRDTVADGVVEDFGHFANKEVALHAVVIGSPDADAPVSGVEKANEPNFDLPAFVAGMPVVGCGHALAGFAFSQRSVAHGLTIDDEFCKCNKNRTYREPNLYR